MSDHAMVEFNRCTKMIQKIDKYVRKRSFRNFQPDAIRACVAGIPELQAILQWMWTRPPPCSLPASQLYVVSVLALTHKIVVSGTPTNLSRIIVSSYPCTTGL